VAVTFAGPLPARPVLRGRPLARLWFAAVTSAAVMGFALLHLWEHWSRRWPLDTATSSAITGDSLRRLLLKADSSPIAACDEIAVGLDGHSR
jgi:hypothetical protein